MSNKLVEEMKNTRLFTWMLANIQETPDGYQLKLNNLDFVGTTLDDLFQQIIDRFIPKQG